MDYEAEDIILLTFDKIHILLLLLLLTTFDASFQQVYDPKINEWRYITPMSTRRSSVGVSVLGGLMYAVGGYDGASRHCLSSVECYNPITKEWGLVCDMSTRRSGAGVGVRWSKVISC